MVGCPRRGGRQAAGRGPTVHIRYAPTPEWAGFHVGLARPWRGRRRFMLSRIIVNGHIRTLRPRPVTTCIVSRRRIGSLPPPRALASKPRPFPTCLPLSNSTPSPPCCARDSAAHRQAPRLTGPAGCGRRMLPSSPPMADGDPACSTAARASAGSASTLVRCRQNANRGGSDPAARLHRDRAGPAAGAAGTRSGRYAALPGRRVRQPAVLWLLPCLPGRGSFSQPGYASEEILSGLDHRQAPFSAEQHSVTGRPRTAGASASGQLDIPQSRAQSAGRHGTGLLQGEAWRAGACPELPRSIRARRGSGPEAAGTDSFTPARPQSRILIRTRAICALIESGHRVSTRKPLGKAQPTALGDSGSSVLRLHPGACG